MLKLKSKPDSREIKNSRESLVLERNQALAVLAALIPVEAPWLHNSRAEVPRVAPCGAAPRTRPACSPAPPLALDTRLRAPGRSPAG